jgi:hypothetical protein
MKDILQFWPAYVSLHEDEILSSFVIRNAFAHFLEIKQFCYSQIPNFFLIDQDVDFIQDATVLQIIADKANLSLSKIKATTLRGDPESRYKKYIKLLANKSKGRGFLFCPRCLKEDGANPFFRKSWREKKQEFCEYHLIEMKYQCKFCNAPVLPLRARLQKTIMPSSLSILGCYQCSKLIC